MTATKILFALYAAIVLLMDICIVIYAFHNKKSVIARLKEKEPYDPSWMDRHKYWEDMK